jgi:hypothetical protein
MFLQPSAQLESQTQIKSDPAGIDGSPATVFVPIVPVNIYYDLRPANPLPRGTMSYEQVKALCREKGW